MGPTVPFRKFEQTYNQLFDFLSFIVSAARSLDEMWDVLTNAQIQVELFRSSLNELSNSLEAAGVQPFTLQLTEESRLTIERLKSELDQDPLIENKLLTHMDMFHEVLLTRSVDNFLTYISDLITLIYKTKPETLRSGETEKLEFILQFHTMDDLVAAIAERRVNELSYQGMRSLSEALSKRMGLTLFERPADMDRAVLLIEIRNIISHNRGIINSIFQSRVGSARGELGSKLTFTTDEVFGDVRFLASAAASIDRRAMIKFGLPESGVE